MVITGAHYNSNRRLIYERQARPGGRTYHPETNLSPETMAARHRSMTSNSNLAYGSESQLPYNSTNHQSIRISRQGDLENSSEAKQERVPEPALA